MLQVNVWELQAAGETKLLNTVLFMRLRSVLDKLDHSIPQLVYYFWNILSEYRGLIMSGCFGDLSDEFRASATSFVSLHCLFMPQRVLSNLKRKSLGT